jgi:hypothetical protein
VSATGRKKREARTPLDLRDKAMSELQDMAAETGNNLDGLGHPDEWPIVIDWNHRRRELIADRRQIREEMERRLAEDNRRQTIAFCDGACS